MMDVHLIMPSSSIILLRWNEAVIFGELFRLRFHICDKLVGLSPFLHALDDLIFILGELLLARLDRTDDQDKAED